MGSMVALKGVSTEVQRIRPAEVVKMKPDMEILVNRIRINTRLVEIESSESIDYEIIDLLRKAVFKSIRGNKYHGYSIGIRMTVGDVLKVFSCVEEMPANSFLSAE